LTINLSRKLKKKKFEPKIRYFPKHPPNFWQIAFAGLLNKKLRFDENYGVNDSVNKVEVLLFYLNVAKALK
jgi:hypothetical protein